ncbi:RING/U-box superfamily protein [Zea mays]|uniref:RING/U-box superfamily protein n=1 Tax=Zea mays TaxID=4577 RepID=A0A1D6KAA8_MAIZE|nr:RING/U-box superfamily protein [Zea mays]
MRLSFSSLAPLFLYFIQWLDCGCCYALPSYLGLFHILICKVYVDGDSSVSTYERRASLREFYAIVYLILQQLESSLIERDLKGKGRCKDIVSRRRMEDWKKVITSHNFHYLYVNLDRLCNLDMDFESN